MPYFEDLKRNVMDRARQALKGRRAMSTTRRKAKKAKARYESKGEAGEQRRYKVDRKSPIGKLQARNKQMKEMMDD